MFHRTLTVAILALGFTSGEAAFGMEADASVSRFIESHCIRCHGEEKQKGKLTLHEAPFDFANTKTSDLWLKILEQLKAGDMPPPDEKDQPSDLGTKRGHRLDRSPTADSRFGRRVSQKAARP